MFYITVSDHRYDRSDYNKPIATRVRINPSINQSIYQSSTCFVIFSLPWCFSLAPDHGPGRTPWIITLFKRDKSGHILHPNTQNMGSVLHARSEPRLGRNNKILASPQPVPESTICTVIPTSGNRCGSRIWIIIAQAWFQSVYAIHSIWVHTRYTCTHTYTTDL